MFKARAWQLAQIIYYGSEELKGISLLQNCTNYFFFELCPKFATKNKKIN